jgi:hypothetical protein
MGMVVGARRALPLHKKHNAKIWARRALPLRVTASINIYKTKKYEQI